MTGLLVPLLFIIGTVFILIAAIGLLRFDNLFSRMHATTKSTSFGILFIIVAVSVYFHTMDIYVKSALIILFIYLTAPLASHSIAKSFMDRKNK